MTTRAGTFTLGPGYGDAVFSDTALYQVNLTAPCRSGGGDLGRVRSAGRRPARPQTWHCVSGPMRDFMIAMSSDYQVKSDTVDGVKINSYYREEFAEEGERGLQVVSDALTSYNQRIGAYPFTELDLIGTPTTAGGIEYPGLVVDRRRAVREKSDLLRKRHGARGGASMVVQPGGQRSDRRAVAGRGADAVHDGVVLPRCVRPSRACAATSRICKAATIG